MRLNSSMNYPVFFVFDVESIGLYGEGYAVGGGIYQANGHSETEFEYACDPDVALGTAEDRKWVAENCKDLDITHKTPVGVRGAFWSLLLMAKKKYPNRTFIQSDLKTLDFKDKSFDWVILISIKEMIVDNLGQEEWYAIEKELKRVGKKVLILEYTEPERYELL